MLGGKSQKIFNILNVYLTGSTPKYAFIAIVKEAVNNIQKHSNAKNASIRVCMHPGFYLLSIADNGTKISTTDSRGIGLSNMEERVRALNGVIRFDTENGFKITIIIRR